MVDEISRDKGFQSPTPSHCRETMENAKMVSVSGNRLSTGRFDINDCGYAPLSRYNQLDKYGSICSWWWCHPMETFSTLLAPVNSPHRSFDVFSDDLRLIGRLSKQSRGWWLETLSRSLWCHSNVINMNWVLFSRGCVISALRIRATDLLISLRVAGAMVAATPVKQPWRIWVKYAVPKHQDDVIKWEHFPRYWSPVRGIHRSPLNSPHTKASDAELWCFPWSVPGQTVQQTIKTPVIWDAIVLIMTSL